MSATHSVSQSEIAVGTSATRWYVGIASVLFTLFVLVFVFFPPAEHYFGYDFWVHVSSVKQLMANPWHPMHPEYATHDTSRQYMPWNLLFALVGRSLHMSVLGVMALESIATSALLLIGIYLFFREYFRNEWAPLAGLFCLLILWGRPAVWSSFYDLWSFLMTAAYPSSFVFAAGFIVWWLGLRALRKPQTPVVEGLCLAFITAVLILAHQLSGAFVLAGLFCFVITEGWRRWSRVALIFGAVLIGLIVSKFWPYFDPWQIASKEQLSNPLWDAENDGYFFRLRFVIPFVGPAAVGVIALWVFLRKRIYLGVVLAFAGSLAAYVIGGIINLPVAHRFLIVWIFYLQLACTWLVMALFSEKQQILGEFIRIGSHARRLIVAALAVLLCFQTGYVIARCAAYLVPASQMAKLPRILSYDDVKGTMRVLTPHMAEDSIVFADEETSVVVPAFKGRIAASYRASPYVPDDIQRFRDGRRFFAPGTTQNERLDLLRKYSATYILYSDRETSPETQSQLREIAKPIASANGFVLLRVGA